MLKLPVSKISPISQLLIIEKIFINVVVVVIVVDVFEVTVNDWEIDWMVFDCRQSNRRKSLRREQNVDVGEQHLKHFHFRLK